MKNMIANRLNTIEHEATDRWNSLIEVTNQVTNQKQPKKQTKNEKRGEVKMKFIQRLLKLNIKGNEKGMTLVELLGVIVILGIVAVIAIPAIGSIISSSEKKAQAANAHMIVDAARHYVSINGFKESATDSKIQKISLTTLVTDGYLAEVPKDPFEKSTTYGLASTVEIKLVTVDAVVAAAKSGTTEAVAAKEQTDTYTYSVYVTNFDDTKPRLGTSTVPVKESDIDKSIAKKV